MALFPLETLMEGAGGVHSCIHDDLHGVPLYTLLGQPVTVGETDQMVQASVHW
jgi:hypothetical protein